MTYGSTPYGSGSYGGGPLRLEPPDGLGISVPLGVGAPLEGAVSASVSVSGTLTGSIAGGPVIGAFRDQPSRINQILDGFDDETITEVARLLAY